MKKSELRQLIREEIQKLNEVSDLKTAKRKAKEISKKEQCVQHVNKVSNNQYRIEDWYDGDSTVCSYENGREL